MQSPSCLDVYCNTPDHTFNDRLKISYVPTLSYRNTDYNRAISAIHKKSPMFAHLLYTLFASKELSSNALTREQTEATHNIG